jgi:signal peptidase I
MQGARRAHIHWPIFNRRATPQDGMHRFPNADVFLGQDTRRDADVCGAFPRPGYTPCRIVSVVSYGRRTMNRRSARLSAGATGAKLVVALGLTALLTAGARGSVAAFYRVAHNSNAPTFFVGDVALANLAAYDLRLPFTSVILARWATPRPGDLVLAKLPGRPHLLAKRVVAVGGDSVELIDNRLRVNGVAASYEHIFGQPTAYDANAVGMGDQMLRETIGGDSRMVRCARVPSPVADFGPLVVPHGHYFVMGDNRDDSYDSRFVGCGPVPRDAILGKVVAKLALTG